MYIGMPIYLFAGSPSSTFSFLGKVPASKSALWICMGNLSFCSLVLMVSYILLFCFVCIAYSTLEGTADMMDWAARKHFFLSSSCGYDISNGFLLYRSARSLSWSRDMVEVFHHWKERGNLGRCTPRYVWDDFSFYSSICAGPLQATWIERKGYHQGPDGWSWYVTFLDLMCRIFN